MTADMPMNALAQEPNRQPALSSATIAACHDVMHGTGLPHQQAAILVHAAAVAQHAVDIGLTQSGAGFRRALDAAADLHPGLAPLAELPTPAGKHDRAVADLWREHRLHDEHTLWCAYPLGDLYQSLSTEAVKGRALCQTPWWITQLLIEIAYNEAQDEFLDPTVMDPACGTGHILVEALGRAASPHRVYDGYSAIRPYRHYYPTMESALDRVHGVELDPWAAAIARYRLLVRAWAELRHRHTISDIAALPLHVTAADALLADPAQEPLLRPGRYHVVLANPPYITPRDAASNSAIRQRFPEVCQGKYNLALPFHALMMRLLVPGGWCAQLTSNSFMMREFGRKYIEQWLAGTDLRWVIDTSGAYIPCHGTPTVILCNRNAPASAAEPFVHTVRGIRGEPTKPEDPSQGLVWRAIEDAVHTRVSYARLARGARIATQLDNTAPDPTGTGTEPSRAERTRLASQTKPAA